jgi:hypothetical protein
VNVRLAALLLLLTGLLSGTGVRADTYDTHTLVTITVTSPEDLRFLQECRIDIVGRRGDAYKALLTDEQLAAVGERRLRVEVLYDEMAEDRRLWREAEAPSSPNATSYYTASKFNLVNPAAGTLMAHLLELYNAHPDICRLYNLGATQDGTYDIIAMKVSRNPDTVEAEPKIRIYGNIHGDEKGSLMVACDVLDTILSGYTAVPQDAKAKKLVEGTEMWFIPMGNPYGNAHNTRYNSRSVDLNRNFWGPSGSDSPPAWSEKETQAIRDLTETATADHRKMRFTTSLSFHGGDTLFNSVWNYTTSAPSDEPIFWASRTGGTGCGSQTIPSCPTLAPDGLAEAYRNGCTTSGFWFTEGYDWYGTKGDTNDWSYSAWSDLDTTIEATATKTPAAAQIPTYTAEHRQAVLNYMLKTFQGIHGVMSDAGTGTPLDGTVAVTATASSSIPVPHDYQVVYTDPVAGDFHRVLQPGTYTVTCHAPGYFDTVVTGVVVTVDMGTQVDCNMTNSTCANNPTAVDVTPNGPLALCTGTGQVLTATPTGGTGLSYQWYDGASPIGGATASTYTASATGTHSYNCRIAGSGCSGGLADGAPTSITWQSVPSFAGLTTVSNPGLATCGLDLSWSAATTPCAGGVTYAVYRSTSTGFTPAPANRIAAGLTGTTYRDLDTLTNGTTYFYIVRAANVSGGTEETNVVEKAGVPYGPSTTQTLTDTFEGAQSGGGFDLIGWTHTCTPASSNADWAWSTSQKYDGTHSWFSASQTTATQRSLVSPAFGVIASTTMSFYHTYAFEGTSNCYDGGTLEVSTDGGGTWTVLPDADFTAGVFNGTASASYSNPIGGKRAWCFGTVGTMTQVSLNLGGDANLVNKTIQIRWREGDDSSSKATGWYVDHVVITNAGTSSACSTGSAIPGEAAPGTTSATAQTWSDKNTQSWPAVAGATSYALYYGLLADLPSLLSTNADSCLKYSGSSTSASGITEDPSAKAGRFYWFLVTASNAAGEGTAGSATAGARIVNPRPGGNCPP